MRENSILKIRIMQYLDYKGIKRNKFYEETGVSNGVLSQNNGLSEDNLLRFLKFYPEINTEWLLTGKGEMLKTAIPEGPAPKDRQKEIDRLLELLDQKDQEIERLKKRQTNFDLQRVAENDPELTKKNK